MINPNHSTKKTKKSKPKSLHYIKTLTKGVSVSAANISATFSEGLGASFSVSSSGWSSEGWCKRVALIREDN